MDKSERIARHRERETRTQERDGVLAQHRDRMANDPEYREAALTAPSITEKRGIHEKVLDRTVPTALSGSSDVAPQGADDSLTGDDLDAALDAAGIDASTGGSRKDGSMSADEKRAALRAKA